MFSVKYPDPVISQPVCIHRENSNIPVKLMNFCWPCEKGAPFHSIEIAIGQKGAHVERCFQQTDTTPDHLTKTLAIWSNRGLMILPSF